MTSNKLSVNPNKTEYLLFNPNNVNLPVNIINLGFNTISPGDSAKNRGIIFQIDMSMDKHNSFILAKSPGGRFGDLAKKPSLFHPSYLRC